MTTNGRQRVRVACDYFHAHHIASDGLYCSMVKRCSGILEIVSGRTDCTRFKDLREFNFGQMEGKLECLYSDHEPNQKGYGDFYLKYDDRSKTQVKRRVSDTVFRLVSQADDDAMILAVSHAGATMSFFSALELDNHPKLHFSNRCTFNYSIMDSTYDLIKIIDPVSGQIYSK